jgi:uncharacterized metal-binding protein
MITVDNFLIKLNQHGLEKFEGHVSRRDLKVLSSLATSVCLPSFITENQARLMCKILDTNLNQFSVVDNTLEDILILNSWSKGFRVIEQVRKIYLDKTDPMIVVEFTHNLAIRKALQNSKFDSFDMIAYVKSTDGKKTLYALTEKNIFELVEILRPFKFDIDEKILNFYEIIRNFQISKIKQDFTFEGNLTTPLKKGLEAELGSLDNVSEAMIHDRKIRYQYFSQKYEKNPKKPENLKETIIFRSQPKVWIDSKKFALEEIFAELKNLNRLPVLVVFDSFNDDACVKNIEIFSKSLEKNEIFENIGIYFRLENNEHGKNFNDFIKAKNYNAQLTDSTVIAGVQTGKLPKFFLKDCNWSPKSVIVLGTNLRHSKTAVYANRCDLILSYAEKDSIIENTYNPWRK